MRTLTRVFCLTLILIFMADAESPGNVAHSSADRMFDQYGDICWEDEKARLDNFAIQLMHEPNSIGYIVVYDGRRACRGEAIARAIRAKKYVVEYRKVDWDKVVWRFGGYREELATELQPILRGRPEWAVGPTVRPEEVIFIGECKGRIRPDKRCIPI